MDSKKLLLWVAVILFPVLAKAGEAYSPIQGEYRVAGPLAFGDIEEGSSHFYLHLTGDSAKSLFQSMDGKAIDDGCSGQGTRIKSIPASGFHAP